jgi:hypothetical protein
MSRDNRGSCFFTSLSLVLLLSLLAGCGGEPGLEKTELLPEASARETNFSPHQPKIPYTQISANLLERQIFQTDGPQGLTVKILDLYIPATKTADNISLPGAAVLEVKYGEGRLVLAGNPLNLSQGTTTSVAQGASFSFQNAGELPLVVQARVIVAP